MVRLTREQTNVYLRRMNDSLHEFSVCLLSTHYVRLTEEKTHEKNIERVRFFKGNNDFCRFFFKAVQPMVNFNAFQFLVMNKVILKTKAVIMCLFRNSGRYALPKTIKQKKMRILTRKLFGKKGQAPESE